MRAGDGHDAAARFRAILSATATDPETAAHDPLERPTRLALACRDVLEVAGVVISLGGGSLTVPLGGSDPTALRAEQLQFTLQQGPMIDVLEAAHLIAAPPAMLRARRPRTGTLMTAR